MIDFPTSRQAMEYLRTTCHCTTIIGLLGSLCEDSYWNDDNNKNNNANDGYSVIHDPSDDLAKIEWHPTSATVVPTKNTNENNAATTMNHHYYLSARSYPAHHYRRMNPSSATSYYNYNNSNDKSSWKRRGNICIALGKERYGLSIQLAQCCDSFLHVPYPSIVRTTTTTLTDAGNPMPSSSAVVVSSLLNVPACLSIALHEITCMYQYHENLFQGHKFDVDRKHTYPVTNSNNSNDDTNDNDNSNTLRPYHKIDTKSHEEVTSFDQQHHDDDGNNWEDDVYNMDNLFGTETEC